MWINGIAVLLIYGAVSYFRVRKNVSDAILLSGNIWQSEKVVSPFILGIIKPKIYIPYGMDGEIRSHVIAHENAHIKRRDHWIKPIGFLLLAVYWFNPLIWIAYILLCKDIERACDEKVISQMNEETRKDYASALLECAVNRRRIAACPLAFGETGLKERVKGIMNYKKPAFWVIVIAVIACIVAAVCFLTNPKSPAEYTELGYRLNITEEIYTMTTQLPDKTEKKSYKVGEGTKGELSNGTKFEIKETNLQTGELTIKFSGEPLYTLVETSIGSGNEKRDQITLLENTPRMLFSEIKTPYREYTFEFVKTDDLETAISDAIIQTHRGGYKLGTYACEDHEIFATESVDTGDYETVNIYMWVNYGEFIKYGDSLVEIGGSACPTVLTFDCVDGKYILKEYWTAEDGTRYADSIREKYPKNIVSEVLNFNYNRKALEKKAEAYFYDNKEFYSATNYGNVSLNVVSYKLDTGSKTDDEEFVRIEWHNQSETEPIFYGYPYRIEKFNPDLLSFEEYKPSRKQLFTLPALLVEPGQKREQWYNLGAYDFSEPGYYRFVTNFNFDEMDREGVAIVDFTVGELKLEEKNPEEYTTRTVYTDNEFKALFSRVGYAQNGADIINKFADKAICTTYSIQTTFPVIKFDSKDELDRFIKEGRETFNLDGDLYKDHLFLKNIKEYNEEFFENKSVILVSVTEPSGSIRHEVDSVIRRDGVVYVFMDRIVPEVCTDDMASWFITVAVDKNFLSDCNNIIAGIGDEVYVPQNTTLKDVVYSVSQSTVTYLENGGEIFAEYAEIPIKTPEGGVDYYHGARFETLEGFIKFYNSTKNIFSYDSIKGYPSFNQMMAQYNKKFFEENSLFLFYIAEPSMDITHEIMYVGKGNNELFIEMKKYVPEAADTAMAGHIIAVSMKKEDAKEVESAVIIVPETVNMSNNPELIKTEPGTLLYVMRTGDSYTKPRVALKRDGSFHFFIAPFGNSCKGNYRLEQGAIILETDDGLYTYVFKEEGNNLIFDADKSSEIAKVSYSVDSEPVLPVEDGDVFTKETE